MRTVIGLLRELAGLFVDDGRLAVSVLAVVALAALVALAGNVPLAAGAVLLFGCCAVLLANVVRAAQG